MEAHGLATSETVHRSAAMLVRHFLEMVVAMWVGMAVGGLIFAPILGAMGMTPSEARLRYPELYLFVMALNMTVPMVAWMRYRGHGWRSCFEMSAAMVLPGVFLLGLFWAGVTGPACGLYCALMIPAMLVVMVYRREEYSQGHRRHAQGQHVVTPGG
jgi:hypothetical protein